MENKESDNNYFINRRNFLFGATLVGASLSILGCKKTEKPIVKDPPKVNDRLKITNFVMESKLVFEPNTNFSFSGQGFAVGDKLLFVSQVNAAQSFTVIITAVTTSNCTFVVPANFIDGDYKVSVSRGTESIYLGATNITVPNSLLPNKAGMTIKGMITSNGVGLANVVVSDGLEVTKTDDNGVYYLPSKKTKYFVFVSIPSGYEVERKGVAPKSVGPLPVFYQRHNGNTGVVDIINFELTRVDNDKHVLLAIGDMHIANRNNDIEQFQKGFLTDSAKTIQKYRSEGYKVYGLTLGDMTWDSYWYDNNYSFPQYVSLIQNMDIPLFHTIGNHDNDPYVANDWNSEVPFRASLGPTYYSFNLGKIHYIVLDNVQSINKGGSNGTIGERNYNGVVVPEQIAWLKKDLATITDKSTPIVLAMHIQLNNQPTTSNTASLRLDNSTELINCFNEFSDVNVITGHTHICYAHENSSKLMEHNSGAVCATWWWTGKNGYAGNNTSKDGAPGGYVIWKFNNKDYDWLYKSVGFEENYQFRAYDLNKCQITAAKFAPNSTDAKMAVYNDVYKTANNNNEILVNVWGYDKSWKVEMFEGSKSLVTNRVSAMDPLHIISYEALRLNVGAEPTADFCTKATPHMFKAKANSATSSILIKVTDKFGNVYQETMTRPKELTVSMK